MVTLTEAGDLALAAEQARRVLREAVGWTVAPLGGRLRVIRQRGDRHAAIEVDETWRCSVTLTRVMDGTRAVVEGATVADVRRAVEWLEGAS